MSIDEDTGAQGHGGKVTDTGVLRYAVDDSGEAAVLTLTGELDLASTVELSASMDELLVTGKDIVVEMAALRFIDSTGMAVLVRAHKGAEQAGHSLTLRHPLPNVAKTLSLAGLDRVFTIED